MAALTVKLKDDHLERLVKTPQRGLTELVWNSLDADAGEVAIHFARNEMDAIDEVRVTDNGSGMTRLEVENSFGSLGGSWKATTAQTTKGRLLHGKKGEGRFAAFGIGQFVAWNFYAPASNDRTMTIVTGDRSSLNEFEISDPIAVTNDPGAEVVVHGISPDTATSLEDPRLGDNLIATFAEYMSMYPDARVLLQGQELDVAALQVARDSIELSVEGVDSPVELVVIEWAKSVDRAIFLSGENGVAVHSIRASIHAPGFSFTAYLKWSGFSDHDALLGELGAEPASSIINAARDALRQHFRDRAQEKVRETVKQWREDGSYPYSGEPATGVESTERQIFDVVAVTAARATDLGSTAQRRLTLRLLREALSNSPNNLRLILENFLDLPPERVDELAMLLTRTSLGSIVSAAKRITDRLAFLEGLDEILFEAESKQRLLERTQLHRIMAAETWVFGEEYSTTGDDEALNKVLVKYLSFLDPDTDVALGDPILSYEEKLIIPDLVLSRTTEVAADRVENLVIEFKRPSVKIGSEQITQIEKYALAIVDDERFNAANVSWDFWLIGNDVDRFAEGRRTQAGLPYGYIQRTDQYAIQVRTWAEVIGAAKHRMKFVKAALDYQATHSDGIDYLREAHAKYLPPEKSETSDGDVAGPAE